jgi:hypothetical protein
MTSKQYKQIGDVLLTIRETLQSHTDEEDQAGLKLIQKVLRLELAVQQHRKKAERVEQRKQ